MAHDAQRVKTESISATFEPELVARFWQQNALRVIRANERIMRGLMTAATREMELSQELMRYNLSRLHKFSDNAVAEKSAGIGARQNFEEFEHIITGFREVSEGLWESFGEASKLLLEGSLTEAVVEPIRKAGKQAEAA
jgi:hypothetical protein